MFKKISMVVVLATTISQVAFAANLSEVMSYTYEKSSTINANRAAVRATDEGVAKAKSGYRPSVIGTGSVSRTHSKSIFDEDYNGGVTQKVYQNPNSVGISFVQPVFSGLSTYNTVEAAKHTVESARADLENTEQSILLDAVSVYMNVLRDRAVLDLQIKNEKVLAEHLSSYKKRFQAGELTRTDVAQSEARLSGAKAARISAEGQLKVSNANYLNVVGLDPEKQMADVNESTISLPASLDEVLSLALKDNPKIKAAEYASKSADKMVSASKGALSPSVDVRATAGKMHNTNFADRTDVWEVSANMNVPLYQSGGEYATIREAKQRANQYRILVRKITNNVRAEATNAWENYTATKAQIKAVEAQIKASKIALEGVIREAKVGSRTVLDVLDAEQEHLDNQVALVKIHRDEIVAAHALLAAIGKLNPTDLNLSVSAYNPNDYYEAVANKWFGYGTDYETTTK